jgi:transglycosylase-like protein with SLT domain
MVAHSVTGRRTSLRLSPRRGDFRRVSEQLLLFPDAARQSLWSLIAKAWLNVLVGMGMLVVLFIPSHVADVGGARSRAVRARTPASTLYDGEPIAGYIRAAAIRYGVPENLISAVIAVESEFNPNAVSRKGATGLMQLMPGTAATVGVRDRRDAPQNIDGGVHHLRALMDRFGNNLPLVLAAYNAGEQPVAVYGGIPPYPETRRFVVRVLRRLGDRHALETVLAQSAPPRRRGPGGRASPASQAPHASAARTVVTPAAPARSVEVNPKAPPHVASPRANDAGRQATPEPSAELLASASQRELTAPTSPPAREKKSGVQAP